MDYWPNTPTSYGWSLTCAKIDRLASWFTTAANRDAFSHLSHTFTHLNLDNATNADTTREIVFNQAWLKQVGISAGTFSPNGLIPPAITGMHNGDAIQAWITNGITQVVGDNSRPLLTNSQNPWWPYITTVASNGYDGLTVVPRWPTTIYYNCDLPSCTLQEWIDTSAGSGDFSNLLAYEVRTTSRYLLAMRQDPYMFHQVRALTTRYATLMFSNRVSNRQICAPRTFQAALSALYRANSACCKSGWRRSRRRWSGSPTGPSSLRSTTTLRCSSCSAWLAMVATQISRTIGLLMGPA